MSADTLESVAWNGETQCGCTGVFVSVREGLRSGVVVFKILKTYLPNCFLTGRFHSVTLYSLYLRPQALLPFLAHSPFRVCPFRGTEVLLRISIYILTKTGHLFKFGFFLWVIWASSLAVIQYVKICCICTLLVSFQSLNMNCNLEYYTTISNQTHVNETHLFPCSSACLPLSIFITILSNYILVYITSFVLLKDNLLKMKFY